MLFIFVEAVYTLILKEARLELAPFVRPRKAIVRELPSKNMLRTTLSYGSQ
jgi:hypothetical protein